MTPRHETTTVPADDGSGVAMTRRRTAALDLARAGDRVAGAYRDLCRIVDAAEVEFRRVHRTNYGG